MDDAEPLKGPESLAASAKMAIAESTLSPEQAMWAQMELDRLVACLKDVHNNEQSWRSKAESLHADVQVKGLLAFLSTQQRDFLCVQRQSTELARVDDNLLDQSSPVGIAQQELLKAGNELTILNTHITDAEQTLDTLTVGAAQSYWPAKLIYVNRRSVLPQCMRLSLLAAVSRSVVQR
jgi:hypothetical protein